MGKRLEGQSLPQKTAFQVHLLILLAYLSLFEKRKDKTNNILYAVLVEKAMVPHSSTLAWKISWTEEPGRLQSMGSLRVGHD